MNGNIRRPLRKVVEAAAVVAMVNFVVFAGPSSVLAQSSNATGDADMKAAVMKQIAGLDYGGPRPTVSVSDGVITPPRS